MSLGWKTHTLMAVVLLVPAALLVSAEGLQTCRGAKGEQAPSTRPAGCALTTNACCPGGQKPADACCPDGKKPADGRCHGGKKPSCCATSQPAGSVLEGAGAPAGPSFVAFGPFGMLVHASPELLGGALKATYDELSDFVPGPVEPLDRDQDYANRGVAAEGAGIAFTRRVINFKVHSAAIARIDVARVGGGPFLVMIECDGREEEVWTMLASKLEQAGAARRE